MHILRWIKVWAASVFEILSGTYQNRVIQTLIHYPGPCALRLWLARLAWDRTAQDFTPPRCSVHAHTVYGIDLRIVKWLIWGFGYNFTNYNFRKALEFVKKKPKSIVQLNNKLFVWNYSWWVLWSNPIWHIRHTFANCQTVSVPLERNGGYCNNEKDASMLCKRWMLNTVRKEGSEAH